MNKINYNFKERTAVVTGGAQGFGFDIAKRFLDSGAKVIIWDIDPKMIEKAVKDLKHGQVIFKAEQQGIIQGTIANSGMDNTQITENLNSFIAELQRLKPASSKGIYLKDIYLSTSMGPGYRIDVSQF